MPSSPEALNTSTLTQHQLEFLVFSQLAARGTPRFPPLLQGQKMLAANTGHFITLPPPLLEELQLQGCGSTLSGCH